MIISRTPIRISYLGGGTDYPSWINEGNNGLVVGSTINRYSYFACKHLDKFFPHKSKISYSEIEEVDSNKDIRHPLIKAVLNEFDIDNGIELIHFCDTPGSSGTGSSSTFLVGLIKTIAAFKKIYMSKADIAAKAIHIEQNVLRECVGYQDSVWAAYGGLNYIKFVKGEQPAVRPIPCSKNFLLELQLGTVLFFTGVKRQAHEVAASYAQNFKGKEDTQNALYALADQGIESLHKENLVEFGELLDKNWQLKRSLSANISSNAIDDIYNRAKEAGAIGGKITGAGGGGCIMFITHPENRRQLINALSDLIFIDFRFDFEGSHIIFTNGGL